MAERYRTPDGWTVEVVTLTLTPDHHDGTWLRVRRYGFHIADVRTVSELEAYVPVAALEPGLGVPPGCWMIPSRPDWPGHSLRRPLPADHGAARPDHALTAPPRDALGVAITVWMGLPA